MFRVYVNLPEGIYNQISHVDIMRIRWDIIVGYMMRIYIYNELYNEDGMGYNDDIMRM